MSHQDPIRIDYKRHISGNHERNVRRTMSDYFWKRSHGEVNISHCIILLMIGLFIHLPLNVFSYHILDTLGKSTIGCFAGLVLLWFTPRIGCLTIGYATGIFLHGLIKLAIVSGHLSSVLFCLAVLPLGLLILIMMNQNNSNSNLSESDRSVLDSWKPIGKQN